MRECGRATPFGNTNLTFRKAQTSSGSGRGCGQDEQPEFRSARLSIFTKLWVSRAVWWFGSRPSRAALSCNRYHSVQARRKWDTRIEPKRIICRVLKQTKKNTFPSHAEKRKDETRRIRRRTCLYIGMLASKHVSSRYGYKYLPAEARLASTRRVRSSSSSSRYLFGSRYMECMREVLVQDRAARVKLARTHRQSFL